MQMELILVGNKHSAKHGDFLLYNAIFTVFFFFKLCLWMEEPCRGEEGASVSRFSIVILVLVMLTCTK